MEGWARYAELLAEEVGFYTDTDALILRRTWLARGMVVDPGIHVMGWNREQAIDFIMEAGLHDRSASAELVDRIVAWPGQLTSYDSGGLEFMAARTRMDRERAGKENAMRSFGLHVV